MCVTTKSLICSFSACPDGELWELNLESRIDFLSVWLLFGQNIRRKKFNSFYIVFPAIFHYFPVPQRLQKPRANGHNIVGCYMLRPFAHPVACCCVLFSLRGRRLEIVGTRKNARERETRVTCLPRARLFSLSPTTSKRLLHRLRIAGSCCAQFETSQSFERTTPNIYSVP